MDLRELFNIIIDTGYPVSIFSKKIGCDNSTLTRWRKGQQKISNPLQEKIQKAIIELQTVWKDILQENYQERDI